MVFNAVGTITKVRNQKKKKSMEKDEPVDTKRHSASYHEQRNDREKAARLKLDTD